MEFDREYTLGLLGDIIRIDSPSGFTQAVVDRIEREAEQLGIDFRRSKKGSAILWIPGREEDKTIGYCAHIDTLGLMVRSIKPNGRLAITNIGGPILPTLDGEYCRVYTRDGKVYTGTVLHTGASGHVYPSAKDGPRDLEHLEIRIDEKVVSAEDTKALGISAGDYICYDPKFEVTPAGFIKSRFLDDKLSAAALFGVLKALRDEGKKPRYNACVILTVYEEVGHGMAHLPMELDELLGVDMGCVGEDLGCDEYMVSICAKDSSGPYDYRMTTELARLCKELDIRHAIDIYPMYSSDISVAMRGGHDVPGALIGAGVHGSHGMERTHIEGLLGTMRLVWAYMQP